jgi:hypothetical protein
MKLLRSAYDSRHFAAGAGWRKNVSGERDAMLEQIWKPLKMAQCDRIGEEVALEALVVFPAEVLPDQPGRILAHRCSQGFSCNALDRPACCWAGSWPVYDPFS